MADNDPFYRAGDTGSEPGMFEDVKRIGKKVFQTVSSAVGSVGDFMSMVPAGKCPNCHSSVPLGHSGDRELTFCSAKCCDRYWAEYRLHRIHATGERGTLCRYPGCDRPCYVDKHQVHNYCGRTHAQEHQKMMGRVLPDDRDTHRAPSYWTALREYFNKSPIRFYNRDDPYYEFTNFYHATIILDEKRWPTSEHYFQAQKFVGTPYMEEIRNLPTARMVFDRSRNPQVSHWCRKDWEDVKIAVMYKALLAKFSQHKELKKLLNATNNRELIEHSPYDSYWGNGGNDSGQNMLGKLLVKVRSELRGKSIPMPHPQQRAPNPPPQPPPQHPVSPPVPANGGGATGGNPWSASQHPNTGTQSANSQTSRAVPAVDPNQYYAAPNTLGPVHASHRVPRGGPDDPVYPAGPPQSDGGSKKKKRTFLL